MDFASRYRIAQRSQALATFVAAAEVVLPLVHPGNLGVLPPSPRQLLSKAHTLGLISGPEFAQASLHLN